jgi:hypothetical protein
MHKFSNYTINRFDFCGHGINVLKYQQIKLVYK